MDGSCDRRARLLDRACRGVMPRGLGQSRARELDLPARRGVRPDTDTVSKCGDPSGEISGMGQFRALGMTGIRAELSDALVRSPVVFVMTRSYDVRLLGLVQSSAHECDPITFPGGAMSPSGGAGGA